MRREGGEGGGRGEGGEEGGRERREGHGLLAPYTSAKSYLFLGHVTQNIIVKIEQNNDLEFAFRQRLVKYAPGEVWAARGELQKEVCGVVEEVPLRGSGVEHSQQLGQPPQSIGGQPALLVPKVKHLQSGQKQRYTHMLNVRRQPSSALW